MLLAVTFKEAYTDGFYEEAMNEQALKKLFQEENLIHDILVLLSNIVVNKIKFNILMCHEA